MHHEFCAPIDIAAIQALLPLFLLQLALQVIPLRLMERSHCASPHFNFGYAEFDPGAHYAVIGNGWEDFDRDVSKIGQDKVQQMLIASRLSHHLEQIAACTDFLKSFPSSESRLENRSHARW